MPPSAMAGNSVLGQQRQHLIHPILFLLNTITVSSCVSQMKYSIWLRGNKLSLPALALKLSNSSISTFTNLKLCLCSHFHAGSSHVNLFWDLFHFGRKYLYQNMRSILCVLYLSILGLIYMANGLTECHTITKLSYTYVNPYALLRSSPFFSCLSDHRPSAMIMGKFVHVQL